jgi:hypothetical protein
VVMAQALQSIARSVSTHHGLLKKKAEKKASRWIESPSETKKQTFFSLF